MRGRLTVGRLIWREMQRAKINTLLCAVTVVVATALLVAMVAISRASVDSTRVMMKQMGFNLLITPQGVDPARYQALDFQDADMPEEYISNLSTNTGIMAQHFVGKYQKTVQVDRCTAVLTGVLAEVVRRGTEKLPMPTAYDVPRGKVFLGFAVARGIGKGVGETVTILGKPFEVSRVLDEAGAIPEDIRIYAHLHDVQELVGRPGRINAIDALACQCPVDVKDIIAALRRNIQQAQPDVNVQPYQSILLARHEQRAMMARFEMVALAIVMLGAAAAIWGLTYQNVHSRRHEIGVLRALGVPDWRITVLFIGKILAYSIVGAVAGCVVGAFGADWFNITGGPAPVQRDIVIWVVAVTPLAAVLFGLPPIVSRLLQEPIDVLVEGEL